MFVYLEPLALVDGALSESVLAELTALYASNAAFFRLSGDFPDPEDIDSEQVASSIKSECTRPASEVLLLHDQPDRLAGLACVLHQHPDPADPDPWIGLLLIHGEVHRRGYGRVAVAEVEKRFRSAGLQKASDWPCWRTTRRR